MGEFVSVLQHPSSNGWGRISVFFSGLMGETERLEANVEKIFAFIERKISSISS